MAEEKTQNLMTSIFGDLESEDEEDDLNELSQNNQEEKNVDEFDDGFGEDDGDLDDFDFRDIESDSDKETSKKSLGRLKKGNLKRSKSPPKKSQKSAPVKRQKISHDDENADEYDSENDNQRTAEDDAFIASDDDNPDLIEEYDAERQNFRERGSHKSSKSQKSRSSSSGSAGTRFQLKKKKTKELSQQEKTDVAEKFLFQLLNAAEQDEEARKANKIAVQKIQLLDRVVWFLRQKPLHETLLDQNVLTGLKKWVQPLPNGSLGNLTVRTQILECLQEMPILPHHLKTSGFGKCVMLLLRHPKETEGNKVLLKKLKEKWSRIIFKKPTDLHLSSSADLAQLYDRQELQSPTTPKNRSTDDMEASLKEILQSKKSETSNETPSKRVRIPQYKGFNFTRPVPQTPLSNETKNPSSKASSANKILKKLSTPGGPSSRAGRRSAPLSSR